MFSSEIFLGQVKKLMAEKGVKDQQQFKEMVLISDDSYLLWSETYQLTENSTYSHHIDTLRRSLTIFSTKSGIMPDH